MRTATLLRTSRIDLTSLRTPPPVENRAVTIYTAITSGYDTLRAQPASATSGCELVAFFQNQEPLGNGWRVRPLYHHFSDCNRNAKIHKVLSHKFFPDVEYSLWIDGNVDIDHSVRLPHLINTYLRNADLAVFLHPHRRCLYQEAAMCMEYNLDDLKVITDQVMRYTRDGYPADNGLVEASVLLRRHTRQIMEFNEEWWQQIECGSRRDQISFNYVARKLGTPISYFPGNLHSHNPYFHRSAHASSKTRIWSNI
jgi:hypothetical protein